MGFLKKRIWLPLLLSFLVFVLVGFPKIAAYYHIYQAEKILDEILGPGDRFFCLGIVENELDKINDVNSAIDHLEKAVDIAPRMQYTHLLLGRMNCYISSSEKAIEHYKEYVAISASQIGKIELGFLFYQLKDYRQAMEHLADSGIDLGDFIELGIQLYKRGDYRRSEEVLDFVISIRPEEATPWYYKGLIFFHDGKIDAALNAFDLALSKPVIYPFYHSDVLFNKGSIYQRDRNYYNLNKALEIFTYAIELNSFSTAQIKAETYYRRGETISGLLPHTGEAIADFNTALTLNPSHFWALLRLGYEYRLIDNDKAIEYISGAIAIWKDELTLKWAYLMLGEVYETAEQYPNSLGAYLKALKLDPQNTTVIESITRVQAILSDKDEQYLK